MGDDTARRLLRRAEALQERGGIHHATEARYQETPDPDWMPEDGVYTDDNAEQDEAWEREQQAYWHAVRTRRQWQSPDDLADPTQKTCKKCGETYDRDYGFNKCAACPDGKFSWCRWCFGDYQREYRARRKAKAQQQKMLEGAAAQLR